MSNEPKLKVLSLGWGVQSFTLAAMSALGDLPKLDVIIHADTTWEGTETYRFEERWQPWLEQNGLLVVGLSSLSAREVQRKGSTIHTPAFFYNDGKARVGQLNRACTDRWKIGPVKKIINQELELRGIRRTAGVVEQWLGISWDEASRAKNSAVSYITIRHPLLERATRMTRADCVRYLIEHGLEVPPKSACTHCVYHSQKMWEEQKRRGGKDWQQSILFDAAIRDKSTRGRPLYIHPSLKPLAQAVTLPEDYGYSQVDLLPGPGCDSAGYCWD